MWAKERFLSMCAEENVTISEMLTRWAATRARVHDHPATEMRPSPSSETPAPRAAREDAQEEQLPCSKFLLQLRPGDLKALKKAAKASPLLATWTTGEAKYSQLALNLALSLRRHAPQLERSFLCVALDRGAKRAMRKHGFKAILHAVRPNDLKDAIWKMRWLILHTFAHLGIDGLVLDSDIVILQDPFPALHRDADLEVMTDHFWPDQHLWQYWTRFEEHINTGCIFVNASSRTEQFLKEFLEDHNETEVGGIPRHWMDQQVFNKFVERRISRDLVHGLYESQVFRNGAERPAVVPLRIRILDPAVVAHGMNYFWLRAHESVGKRAVLAHANGVDGKEYFLRDRNLWYIDDFEERFARQSFLTYDHPGGMSLAQDFEYLTKAMVVAAALRRRLVLPNTMNCNNCPALEPYKATTVLGTSNCTFDYFAWSQSFLGHHGALVAESGLRHHPRFAALASADLDPADVAGAEATWPPRVHLRDVSGAFQASSSKGFSLEKLFECRFQEWPVGWMACRDLRFVSLQGTFARCEPQKQQSGCGLRGFSCCEAFWGWGEKLEYFTGKPWDLPCNCGLSACREMPSAQACCALAGKDADVRCERLSMALPEVNTPEDSESLTSTALSDLDTEADAKAFWRTCRLNRQLRHRDRTLEELVGACHSLATRYLLLRQNLAALGAWCRFSHRLRWGMEDGVGPLALGQCFFVWDVDVSFFFVIGPPRFPERRGEFELWRLTLVLKVTTDSGRHLNHTQIRTLSACRMTLLDSCSVRHFGELAKFFFFFPTYLPCLLDRHDCSSEFRIHRGGVPAHGNDRARPGL
ncbi:unnamed protein product [Effrenium voratum]|nr:unnamed protein product [Effrenium voratum]